MKYDEMRSHASDAVKFERGENQKETTTLYKKNYNDIFRSKKELTHNIDGEGKNGSEG